MDQTSIRAELEINFYQGNFMDRISIRAELEINFYQGDFIG